jgi:tetratricopeptide (TPR) repeat protein
MSTSAYMYARTLRILGRFDDALALTEDVIATDPMNFPMVNLRVEIFTALGNEKATHREIAHLLAISPNTALAAIQRSGLALGVGDLETAEREIDNLAAFYDDTAPYPIFARTLLEDIRGNIEQRDGWFDKLQKLEISHYVPPALIGRLLFLFQRDEEAFEWYEKALEVRDEWLLGFLIDRRSNKDLLEDPRGMELLMKAKLKPEWVLGS